MMIDDLVSKKRLQKGEKYILAKFIIKKCLKLIEEKGEPTELKNTEAKPMEAKYKSLIVWLISPHSKLPGVNYLLDVWLKENGKVFSVHWVKSFEDIEELDIVNFKRGDWILELKAV